MPKNQRSLPALPARSQTTDIIRVGYVPAEVSAEVFYAHDTGIFRRHGFDVSLQAFANPGTIAASLVGGALDVGIYDVAGLIAAHGHGVPLVLLATDQLFDESDPVYATIVKADSPIREAKDFKGTFAVSSVNNIAALGTLAWVDKNGGDAKAIKFVELPFPNMQDGVNRGTVDAAVPTEPWVTNAVKGGFRAIAPHRGIAPSYVLSGWVTTTDWADAHANLAARFVSSIYETAVWANRSHSASAPILANYTKLAPSLIASMNRGTFAERTNVALLQPVVDAAARYGLVSRPFPATELYGRAALAKAT